MCYAFRDALGKIKKEWANLPILLPCPDSNKPFAFVSFPTPEFRELRDEKYFVKRVVCLHIIVIVFDVTSTGWQHFVH